MSVAADLFARAFGCVSQHAFYGCRASHKGAHSLDHLRDYCLIWTTNKINNVGDGGSYAPIDIEIVYRAMLSSKSCTLRPDAFWMQQMSTNLVRPGLATSLFVADQVHLFACTMG